MNEDEKKEFIATAEPCQIQAMFPFEYTLQLRMGASRWHLSAERMSDLEAKMYRHACDVKQFEDSMKEISLSIKKM